MLLVESLGDDPQEDGPPPTPGLTLLRTEVAWRQAGAMFLQLEKPAYYNSETLLRTTTEVIFVAIVVYLWLTWEYLNSAN